MPHETFYGRDVATVLAEARAALGDNAVVVELRRLGTSRRAGFELIASDAFSAATQEALSRPLPGDLPPARSAPAASPDPAAPRLSALARALLPATPHSPARAYSAARLATPGVDPAQALAALARVHARPHPAAPELAREAVEHAAGAAAHALQPAELTAMVPGAILHAAREAGRPAVLAIVGPTGAGKTTTLAKLANHAAVFGAVPVGLLSLDTYRIGAIEQTRIYAELSRLPAEIVYETRQLPASLKRLRHCDVILVDTAGRGPRGHADAAETRAQLRELAPDEIHLAVPAGLRREQVRRIVEAHLPIGITHLVASKVDEDPADVSVFDVAVEAGLPMRWIADGQDVPADLHSAVPWLDAARTRAVQAALAEAR